MDVLDTESSAMQRLCVYACVRMRKCVRSTSSAQTSPSGTERIHVFHLVDGGRADDVVDADDVLMFEAQQDLDLAESALAVRLVLERADLLYGHAHFIIPIIRRTKGKNKNSVKKNPPKQALFS